MQYFILFLVIVIPSLSIAGQFMVSPTSLSFTEKQKTATLKLLNQGPQDVTIQVEGKEWIIGETGKDAYLPTKNIVVFPKIVKIPKQKEVYIRVGYQKRTHLKEQSYRLFLQELPVSETGEMSLNMVLTLSIPVFIKPDKEETAWIISDARLEDGSVRFKVENTGNQHIVNHSLKLAALDPKGVVVHESNKTGWYVLADSIRSYDLSLPLEKCLDSKWINLEVSSKDDIQKLRIPAKNFECSESPVKKSKKM